MNTLENKPLLHMKFIVTISLFLTFCTLQHIAAQNLIPWFGSTGLAGKARYGYATEDGQVVIKPGFQGIHEILPSGKIFTNLNNPEMERALMRPTQPPLTAGKAVFLLRSGRRIAAEKPRDVVVGVQNYTVKGEKIDSIGHLVVFPKEKELVFFDLRKNTGKTYLTLTRNNSRDWFSRRYIHERGYLDPFRFTYGAMEVWKTPNTMNFVDTDLKDIFPRDFAAGYIADANHFILAEALDHYAIGDRSGKVRTPFVWTSIEPAGREGLFIVTGPRYNHGKSGIKGMIDANGKIVLDTVYRNISPFGNVLIVEKDNKYGLMDHAGNIVLPITANSIYPVSNKHWMTITDTDPNSGALRGNLLDASGKRMLPDAVRGVGFPSSIAMRHYLVQFPEYMAFYDAELQEIARFKGFDNGGIVEVDPLVFRLSKIAGNKYEFGLYDRDGKMLHPEGFDELLQLVRPHFYRVKKDTLFGVIDRSGRTIVPAQFLSIQEEIFRKDTLFWGEEANGRWSAFDRQGNKQPQSGRMTHSSTYDPVVGMVNNKATRAREVILPDGTRMPLPDSLKDWYEPFQLRTPNGGLVIYYKYIQGKQVSLYLNEKLQQIIPPGFVAVPDQEQTGLVTVMRIKADKKTAAPKPKNESEVVVEAAPGESYPALQTDLKFDACGVLNADGKWVLPPKTGVIYKPISYYMVLEIPDKMDFRFAQIYADLLRIHRVNQPAQPPIEVNYIRDRRFEKGITTMLLGKVSSNSRERVQQAYFDEKGNQLTPFSVQQGPSHLESRNVVSMMNPDNPKELKHSVIDEKGKILFDLGNLGCKKFPHEKGQNWNFDYIVVMEQLSAAENEKISKMPIQELSEVIHKRRFPQGIMDSAGRLVHPLKYFALQIIKPDGLFGARDTNGVALLYNWQGELLHRFPNRPKIGYQNSDSMSGIKLQDGHMVVSDGMTTALVSNDNRLIRTFELPFSGNIELDRRVFTLKDKEGNLIWVRSKDGFMYKE